MKTEQQVSLANDTINFVRSKGGMNADTIVILALALYTCQIETIEMTSVRTVMDALDEK